MNHVCLLIPGLNRIGGAERQLMLLAAGLRRRSWQVSVVTLSGTGGSAAIELRDRGIAFHSLRMRRGILDPRGWIAFHSWLRRHKPDVVHSHLPHAAWLARGSRLFTEIPVLIDTFHSSSTGTLGRRLAYRLSRWVPDAVTAVSRAVAESHLNAGIIQPDSLCILPNAVDTRIFRPDAARHDALHSQLGLGNCFLWLAAGRLEPVKDYPALLRAMAQLSERAQLMIAGSGSEEPLLRRLCAELGLERRVRFAGFVQDISLWMQAADAFVLSSQWEGLPVSLMEAEACALPVVASDVPGVREAMLPEQSGFLAAPGDARRLAKRMHALMHLSPLERKAMGICGRKFVQERFALEAVLGDWEALYLRLIAQSARLCGNEIEDAHA